MRIFYVDFENVQSLGLNGVDKLTSDDKLVILYSAHADTMKIEVVRQLQSTAAEVEFIEAEAGTPNALDFQLVAILFMDINVSDEIYIVSRDTGFDVAINIAAKRGFSNIKRIPRIERLDQVEAEDDSDSKIASSEEIATMNIIMPIIKEDSSSQIEAIIREKCGDVTCRQFSELIITGLKKSSNKQQFYQFFRTNLGDGQGGDLYRSIRNKYDEMKALV